jgi:hypothetical protein
MISPMDNFGDARGAGRGPSHGQIMEGLACSDDLLAAIALFGVSWTKQETKC